VTSDERHAQLLFLLRRSERKKQRHHDLQTCCHGSRQPWMMQPRQWPPLITNDLSYQSAAAILYRQRRGRWRSPSPPTPAKKAHLWLPLFTTLFLHKHGWQFHHTCLGTLKTSIAFNSTRRIYNVYTAAFLLMPQSNIIFFSLKCRAIIYRKGLNV